MEFHIGLLSEVVSPQPLPRNNGELVARLAGMCANFGRHAAGATEAQQSYKPTG
jgi:hypothetical protein